MTNKERFLEVYHAELAKVWESPAYTMARRRHASAMALATLMVDAMQGKCADIHGDTTKAACRALGIKQTMGGIAQFLNS